ncbi:LLM class flavin-dependent oxidoreductase [Cryptosporangium aurantiacum]|uniref:Flavin-dependent oxidoreductase, luciferase family (Includes alkanesulfonate monooxygenase SsuD and methylene tetrahydromethanopterin reductase) n=1 Tax=Cryptosporangium aurantiacum TaxID=134849 RepID=A0A1M7TUA2_9ACTN|nr:LLM class flavin-dependent oxidoreductase [Cryptosporangium aurantiacum]SHN74280.1 Flavin-dependent oxidoreductase, luciferase family (includes alkanesulfonate monooxygenase SsuD and methylene tetrahydromethanopterin reductase) [Cryptosporangium aurantiacum]
MSAREGHVILGVNTLVLGYLPAAWQWDARLTPDAPTDPGYWQRIAATAERATLDAFFLADGPALGDPSYDANVSKLEPTINWAHLAAATEHLGLIATASTTFNDPFELAERLLSLDHVSDGRAGWNIVTTRHGAAAGNFGLTGLPERSDRYERAVEFVDLVVALWESARTGVDVDHAGEHFTLRGRLRVPPSPQGKPVLLQAGGSEKGRRLAGTRADGVFAAELTKEGAIEHYNEVKQYAADAGRDPDTVKILPGVLFSLGSTEEEARRRSDALHDLGPSVYSAQWLSGALGIDATTLDLDAPFPPEVLAQAADPAFQGGSIGFRQSIVKQIRATNPTVREYLKQTRYTGSGHHGFVGTPEQFVDHIEDWYRSGAIDGFNLQPDVLIDGLEVIADEVVPLLRKRGLFRHEYETTTLRGHFGGSDVA